MLCLNYIAKVALLLLVPHCYYPISLFCYPINLISYLGEGVWVVSEEARPSVCFPLLHVAFKTRLRTKKPLRLCKGVAVSYRVGAELGNYSSIHVNRVQVTVIIWSSLACPATVPSVASPVLLQLFCSA